MNWPLWVVGGLVGWTIGMLADAFHVPIWQAIVVMLTTCLAVSVGATRVDGGRH